MLVNVYNYAWNKSINGIQPDFWYYFWWKECSPAYFSLHDRSVKKSCFRYDGFINLFHYYFMIEQNQTIIPLHKLVIWNTFNFFYLKHFKISNLKQFFNIIWMQYSSVTSFSHSFRSSVSLFCRSRSRILRCRIISTRRTSLNWDAPSHRLPTLTGPPQRPAKNLWVRYLH